MVIREINLHYFYGSIRDSVCDHMFYILVCTWAFSLEKDEAIEGWRSPESSSTEFGIRATREGTDIL